MRLKKYEVKESEFPKKEGTDDFAMSAGFFEYLDRTHDFQSKAALENYCKYWTDRHSVDHPDAVKYNKYALWNQYKDQVLYPWKKFVLPVLISVVIIAGIYLVGSMNFDPEVHSGKTMYVNQEKPDYGCIVTNNYRSKVDFTEVEFKLNGRYHYYPVISGKEYLEYNQGIHDKLIFKFINGGGVSVDNLNNYEKIEIKSSEKIKDKYFIAVDKNIYKQYYLAGGVSDGFLDKYIKVLDDKYIIDIESSDLSSFGTVILFIIPLVLLGVFLKKLLGV